MKVINADYLERAHLEHDDLRELASRARHVVVLDILGVTLGVHFDEAAAARIFAERYRAFQSMQLPTVDSFAVRSKEPGGVFWSGPAEQYVWPFTALNPAEMAFLADAVSLGSLFNSFPRTIACLHGAAVRAGDLAAGIFADTTGGKTTTAIACARRGMLLYSDERCIVENGLVLPFPRAMGIREGGLRLLLKDAVPEDGGIGKRLNSGSNNLHGIVDFAALLGTMHVPEPAPLRAAFFLRNKCDVPAVTPIHWAQAIPLVLERTQGPKSGIDQAVLVGSTLKNAACYHLDLGRPDETARMIETVIGVGQARAAASSPIP